jgi:hypothetical protein
VKEDHQLVGVDLADVRRQIDATVDHLRSTLGEDVWAQGMNPDVPDDELFDNPYQYTDYAADTTPGD